MFNIIENFLEKETLEKIKLEINKMHWYYLDFTAQKNDRSNFHFYHMIYENDQVESQRYFNTILMPILGRLNFNYLHRAKLNLYTKQHKQIKTGYHTDDNIEHTVALISLNTNNGYTEFEDGTKVESVANRLVMFPSNTKHRGITQTDEQTRIMINFNFLKRKKRD